MPYLISVIYILLFSVAHGAPHVRCASLAEALKNVNEIPLNMSYGLRRFSDIDLQGFETKGGVPDSSVHYSGQGNEFTIWLPYKGTPEKQEGFVELVADIFWPSAVIQTLQLGETSIEALDGSWIVVKHKGGLLFKPKMDTTGLEFPTFAPELGEKTCQFLFERFNFPMIGSYFGDEQVVLDYSFAHKSLNFFFPSSAEDVVFQPKPHKRIEVKTAQIPLLSFSLGESPISLLSSNFAPEGKRLNKAQTHDMAKKLRVPAGGALGIFSMKPLEFAMVLPVRTWCGWKMPAWRLWWGLKSATKKMERTIESGRKMSLKYGDMDIHLQVRRGMVYLSTDPAVIDDMQTENGASWLQESMLPSDEWPTIAQIAVPPELMFVIGPLTRLELGLRSIQHHRELAIHGDVRGKVSPKRLVLHYFASQQGFKNQQSTPISEITWRQALAKLAAAENKVFAQTGAYKGWSFNEPPSAGFSCFSAEELKNRIWVEVEKDAFTVKIKLENGVVWSRDNQGKVTSMQPQSTPKE